MHTLNSSLKTPLNSSLALGLALLGGLGLAAAPVQAQNLVTNPGFETGDFTGWATTPATDGGSDFNVFGAPYANSGGYGAAFGAVGAQDDGISQLLPTVAGDDYAVSFSLENLAGPQNDFHASFGGVPLLDLKDSSALPYTQYAFTATATDSTALLAFAGRQVPSFYVLDDVSVTDLGAAPVPEASTTVSFGLLLVLGLGGAAVAARRKKMSVKSASAL